MNEVVQFGVPARPPWARNWFEKLQLRLHITPCHMRAVLEREELILSKASSILSLLIIVHQDCVVEVYWPERQVKILHGQECIGAISFDELLNADTSTRFIVDHVLSCIGR